MSGALKFVKVIVAPAHSPAALYGSPHINASLWRAAGCPSRPGRHQAGFLDRAKSPSSTCSLEPGSDTAGADETANPPHLQINPAGGRNRALMAMEGEAVRRPFVLVRGVTDTEIESVEVLRDRLIDQVLQQEMADAVAAESRVVGRENIIEPAAPDEAEMRRRHGVADRQRRKMADFAEPGGAYHLAVKALDAGGRQKIRR